MDLAPPAERVGARHPGTARQGRCAVPLQPTREPNETRRLREAPSFPEPPFYLPGLVKASARPLPPPHLGDKLGLSLSMAGAAAGSQPMNRFVTILVIILLVVLIAVGGLALLIRQSFPQTSGEVNLPGLHTPVEVLRDGGGPPHIYAPE